MVEKKYIVKDEDVKQELEKSIHVFKKNIHYMFGDAPISVLCLPKTIETVLISEDCLRVYDLFNRDLTKIKGIGKTRVRLLAASLEQFISVF